MKDKPYVIFVTDRKVMGSPMRAIPKSWLGQKTTMTMSRAKRFATKREAKLYIRSMTDLGPRYVCTIANEHTLSLVGVRRSRKPWVVPGITVSRERQGTLFSGDNRVAMHDDFPLGPTGEYPDGKIGEDDGGECDYAVGCQRGRVMMTFGVPVRWVAMQPEDARQLAQSLIKFAMAIDGKLPIIEIEL